MKNKMECPHCKKIVESRLYNMWHGDNCSLVKPRINNLDIEFTQENVKKVLSYNPETGKFYRIDSKRDCYKNKEVGTVNKKTGYIHISVLGKTYYAHRLAWFIVHGYMPENVDHIDGNPTNNKIENLRECTQKENLQNKKSNIKGENKGITIKKGLNYNTIYLSINGINTRFKCDDLSEEKLNEKLEYVKDYANIMRKNLHGDFANDGLKNI